MGDVVKLFAPGDEQRISRAITAAEQATSGEIIAVVYNRSDSYLHVPYLVAALAALLVPWPLIYLTWAPVQKIFLVQLVAFVALVGFIWPQHMRMLFVPQSVKRANVHRRAVEQFLAQNLHTTATRTGVLIFVSLAERQVEILADQAIDKAVDAGTWQTVVDQLTADLAAGRPADGFVRAVETCGKLMAKHFPPETGDSNELPNHLIILS